MKTPRQIFQQLNPNSKLILDLPLEIFSSRVCKLRKSLYRLKQSPWAWVDKLAGSIKRQGYFEGQPDHTMFFKRSADGKIAILIVYFDDIILNRDGLETLEN